MVKMGITKMSSKGQIVIPSDMRVGMKEGDEFLILKDDDRIILKKIGKMTEKLKEDLEFAKGTEKAWQEIERGEGTRMSAEEFFKELKKW